MIQVNRIYLIFNRLVTKKFLVDTSENGNIINFAHHCYNINQFIIIKIQYHYK